MFGITRFFANRRTNKPVTGITVKVERYDESGILVEIPWFLDQDGSVAGNNSHIFDGHSVKIFLEEAESYTITYKSSVDSYEFVESNVRVGPITRPKVYEHFTIECEDNTGMVFFYFFKNTQLDASVHPVIFYVNGQYHSQVNFGGEAFYMLNGVSQGDIVEVEFSEQAFTSTSATFSLADGGRCKVLSFGNKPIRSLDLAVATDVPVSLPITLKRISFEGNPYINSPVISQWNTENLQSMSRMFWSCLSFNQPISNWDVRSVNDFDGMFDGATVFNQDISNWVVYTSSKPNRFNSGSALTDERSPRWGSYDRPYQFGDDMSVYWINDRSINIPFGSSYFAFANLDFDAATSGTYEVSVGGDDHDTAPWKRTYNLAVDDPYNYNDFPWIGFGYIRFKKISDSQESSVPLLIGNYVVKQLQFGENSKLIPVFDGCLRLTTVDKTLPSYVNTIKDMFTDAVTFNQDLSTWNVSNVISGENAFMRATSFNGNIGAWNTSSFVNMKSMFQGATSFNVDIGGWPVGQVTSFDSFLNGASSFNQNLTCWSVAHIPATPNQFSVGSAIQSSFLPLWGQSNTNMTGRTGASCRS